MSAANETRFTWHAAEYEHRHKADDWYWALGILTVAGATASILFGNVLFALVILIGAFSLALLARREPPVRRFEVTKRGVIIDDTVYPFRNLVSFWIAEPEETGAPHAHLFLTANRLLMPQIIIPLADVHIRELREFLLLALEEREDQETVSHRFAEWIGLV